LCTQKKKKKWKKKDDLFDDITCDSNLLLSVKPSKRILSSASEELLCYFLFGKKIAPRGVSFFLSCFRASMK